MRFDEGSRELPWPTLIGLFSVIVVELQLASELASLEGLRGEDGGGES